MRGANQPAFKVLDGVAYHAIQDDEYIHVFRIDTNEVLQPDMDLPIEMAMELEMNAVWQRKLTGTKSSLHETIDCPPQVAISDTMVAVCRENALCGQFIINLFKLENGAELRCIYIAGYVANAAISVVFYDDKHLIFSCKTLVSSGILKDQCCHHEHFKIFDAVTGSQLWEESEMSVIHSFFVRERLYAYDYIVLVVNETINVPNNSIQIRAIPDGEIMAKYSMHPEMPISFLVSRSTMYNSIIYSGTWVSNNILIVTRKDFQRVPHEVTEYVFSQDEQRIGERSWLTRIDYGYADRLNNNEDPNMLWKVSGGNKNSLQKDDKICLFEMLSEEKRFFQCDRECECLHSHGQLFPP